jgi:hypothetical protein
MSAARLLPAQFAALAPFVTEWALPTEADRLKKLTGASLGELKEFYDAVFARAEEMKAYLMPFRLDAMPEEARTLFDLLLTFIETAHPIELNWTTTDIDDAFALDRMTIANLDAFPPR